MKYVVKTETTGTFDAALAFDNLADAKEQLHLWNVTYVSHVRPPYYNKDKIRKVLETE